MADLVAKFTGQAKHVIEQKPTQHDEYSERDDLLQQYIKRILSAGTYMVPRDVFAHLTPDDWEDIQAGIRKGAIGGETICTSIEEDFENNRYILRWWTQ